MRGREWEEERWVGEGGGGIGKSKGKDEGAREERNYEREE